MLKIQNLTKSVKEKKILTNININIENGSIVSILGPSGSGKTTILRIIMGLENYEKGTVLFGDTLLSIGKKIIVPAAQRKFAFVFQDFTLFPHLDVYKNIIAGLDHMKQSDRRTIAEELLTLFEISQLKHQPINTLSGGEQQRVAIASSLAVRPKILMLDEPFSNIDRKMKEYLYNKLHKILKKYNITTILATHDHGEAFFLSDHIYVLRDGRIQDNNSPYLLYTQPADPWVASFIGDVNYLSGYELKTIFNIHNNSLSDDSYYLIRPEEFRVSGITHGENTYTNACIIERIEFYGFYRIIIAVMPNGKKIKIKDLHQVLCTVGEKVAIVIVKKSELILLNKFSRIKEKYHENNP